MKKIVFIMLIALAITGIVSAQDFVVHEVRGKVERNTGGKNWTAVKAGDSLQGDSVIRTVIGSNLTVKLGDDIYTIGPRKNGKLSDIMIKSAANQGGAVQTDTTTITGPTSRTDTASARSSDAAEELELIE